MPGRLSQRRLAGRRRLFQFPSGLPLRGQPLTDGTPDSGRRVRPAPGRRHGGTGGLAGPPALVAVLPAAGVLAGQLGDPLVDAVQVATWTGPPAARGASLEAAAPRCLPWHLVTGAPVPWGGSLAACAGGRAHRPAPSGRV